MKKTKLLNLYSGVGGNVKLLDRTKYEITSIELDTKISAKYKELFPDDILINADAKEYLLNHFEEFDIIWASPPCQSHSKMAKFGRNRKPIFTDMALYEVIMFLKNYCNDKKWVVENVVPYYKPLIEPTIKIERHLFWSNFEFEEVTVPGIKNFINKTTVSGSNELKEWLGLNYTGNVYYRNNHCPAQVLRNCVHPLVGKHIIDSIENKNTKKKNKTLI